MSILPGPIRQIGYVVRDIDQSMENWLRLGVGPWFVMRELTIPAFNRGEPCEVTESLALTHSGDLQIELIQPHGDGPNIFTEFLSSKGEGFHQLAYWTDDFGATMDGVRDAGWPTVFEGGADLGVRFVYVQPQGSPAEVIEISELTEATTGLAAYIRQTAANWDGSDPIRALSG